ncbi:hypothetical protein [Parapedobacter sp. 2B3]|uniref:hypothetical protein n=1 Tax=Parapedobacter sp. 2B3 TaxID=3342381 RepID=UPI0035B60F6D
MPVNDKAWVRLWGMPILMGLITLVGLLLAIMGTGLWLHVLSWIALAIPLFAMARYGARFFKKG